MDTSYSGLTAAIDNDKEKGKSIIILLCHDLCSVMKRFI